MFKRLLLLVAVLCLLPLGVEAQEQEAQQPNFIVGTYSTTYYAPFNDWDVFPVLLPILNADTRLQYHQRYDLRPEAQITGVLRGGTERGDYRIDLPEVPTSADWFDTDGNPATPSQVKLFVVGIANGMVSEEYVSRYDFLYTRSFGYNPNTRTWEGRLLAWAAEASPLPVLPGTDGIFYSADDIQLTVPAGWSVIEVQPDPLGSSYQVELLREAQPRIILNEPRQFEDVDLSSMSYGEAFLQLLDYLEATYVFTSYREIDWELLRQKYGSKAGQVQDDSQFYSLLQTALFSFRDGHLAILGPGIPSWYFGRLGMRVYPVEGELMVIEVSRPSPVAQGSPITPGTVITAVNGIDAMQFFDQSPRMVYSSGHASQDLWFRGNIAFSGEPGSEYSLDYRLPDGSTGSSTLYTQPLNRIGASEALQPHDALRYSILEGNIGYIAIHNFTSGSVVDRWDEAIRQLNAQQVEGIVIDLRRNSGGFSVVGNYMLGDFLDEDVFSGEEVSSLDEDGDGQSDVRLEYYYGRQRLFDPAKVAVLVGPYCFSACEFTAAAFREIGATVVGHLPSGGAGGGVGATYYLPGGTRVYGMAVVMSLTPEGDIRVEGVGVQPDVQVPFTAQGLASGEDVVLRTALQLLHP